MGWAFLLCGGFLAQVEPSPEFFNEKQCKVKLCYLEMRAVGVVTCFLQAEQDQRPDLWVMIWLRCSFLAIGHPLAARYQFPNCYMAIKDLLCSIYDQNHGLKQQSSPEKGPWCLWWTKLLCWDT